MSVAFGTLVAHIISPCRMFSVGTDAVFSLHMAARVPDDVLTVRPPVESSLVTSGRSLGVGRLSPRLTGREALYTRERGHRMPTSDKSER